ncbi:hypothetical protein CASFOL_026251 [Castilleja foliolosa]|uniref:GRF-type domain-containing protein n=1 Tax=Castilleja foliolosa TaxID=1961234 RepID=A0ABD3CK62_9LAMI
MSSRGSRSNQSRGSRSNQTSRSSKSYGSDVAGARCHCGIELEVMTSWTDDNPGRRFQGCPNYKKPSCCGFFRWVDEEVCSRSKQIIPGLIRKKNKLELELASEQEKLKCVQRSLNVSKKKEKKLKMIIAAMVLIFAFQVMLQLAV